jgi:hypothetical protein
MTQRQLTIGGDPNQNVQVVREPHSALTDMTNMEGKKLQHNEGSYVRASQVTNNQIDQN